MKRKIGKSLKGKERGQRGRGKGKKVLKIIPEGHFIPTRLYQGKSEGKGSG